MKTRARYLLLCASLLGVSASASAQVPEPAGSSGGPNVDEARLRFRRGAELYKEGSLDAALAEFSRAYELAPNYRLFFNLGRVEAERHDYASALKYFQDYLEQGGAEIPEDRRALVEQQLESLKGRVAELSVTGTAGAELSIDGVAIGTLPLKKPVIVSSGVRQIALKKPGYTSAERKLTVSGGEHPQLELPLERVSAVPSGGRPASSTNQASSSHGIGAGTWTGIIASGAFASAAVVFGVMAKREQSDLKLSLAEYPADRERVADERSKVKLYAGLTDGFAGAAVLSAAITTIAVLSSGRSETPTSAKQSRRPELVAHGNGLAVRGQF